MKILSIETSCDETAVAVLEVSGKKEPRFRVRQNVLASQIETHRPFGGVVPHLAAREHAKNLPILTKEVLKREPKVDLITATKGPGLLPALVVGVTFAKMLAATSQRPIVGVNHLEGHIYSNWLERRAQSLKAKSAKLKAVKFPALCLIVSGGHTQLILMKNHGAYELLGETRDDAAGEAFDKVARMLRLGYPGGPEISRFAKKGNPDAIAFPRPMMHTKDFEFSFSGLKSAVR
ncbi:tRNA (adenosine(37)-N6)-threonylcarbamoyltransferase complex transferase subunit TsaD, partial [Candidatus Azambacteria bacterium]|nr:tRNA (adenosine(37)-N6)-threonylcarbamoyltransferase complex transferase subunit TsaD [Candidatus Azambacteria bacterium]